MSIYMGRGYLEARRADLRSWNKRKWARWFTPNWVSKPSAVLDSGIAIYWRLVFIQMDGR